MVLFHYIDIIGYSLSVRLLLYYPYLQFLLLFFRAKMDKKKLEFLRVHFGGLHYKLTPF